MLLLFAGLIAITIASLAGCAALERRPVPAPDVTFTLMDGTRLPLSSLRGRPVVLNFGATWCRHCVAELPEFEDLTREYGGRAAIYCVFVRSERGDVEALLREKAPSVAAAFDPDSETCRPFGVKGMPVTFFIDRDGNIVEENFGGMTGRSLRKKVEGLLAENEYNLKGE